MQVLEGSKKSSPFPPLTALKWFAILGTASLWNDALGQEAGLCSVLPQLCICLVIEIVCWLMAQIHLPPILKGNGTCFCCLSAEVPLTHSHQRGERTLGVQARGFLSRVLRHSCPIIPIHSPLEAEWWDFPPCQISAFYLFSLFFNWGIVDYASFRGICILKILQ